MSLACLETIVLQSPILFPESRETLGVKARADAIGLEITTLRWNAFRATLLDNSKQAFRWRFIFTNHVPVSTMRVVMCFNHRSNVLNH